MKSHLNSISSPSQKNSPSTGSVQLVKQYGAEELLFGCHPKFSQFCMGNKAVLWPHIEHSLGCSDGNETALAATSRQTPVLCFVVTLRPGLQSLVRKCLRVTAACSAKSHFILLMDRWTDGCLVKAALSDGASE